ncbi:MAG: cyclic nucleotide-binding domain-containing protein [Alphaproteobacteria bacterium]|nr:cyclic nucleotide-binding domain-containing protein [Alphaproteobacteria bacterium]
MTAHADFEPRRFPKGTVVFHRNDHSDYAYVVQSGAVDILIPVSGKDRVIESMGRGDIFGEMALIDRQPRSATAVAREDTTCLVVTPRKFQEVLDNADPFVYALLRLLNRRLRHTTSLLNELPKE